MTRFYTCRVCGALVLGSGTLCATHRTAWGRAYDAARPEHHAFYQTPEWRRLSAEVRAGVTRCHWCLKPTRRLIADHVVPIDVSPEMALVRANIVPSCYGCNTRRGRNAKLPDLDPVPGARGAAHADPPTRVPISRARHGAERRRRPVLRTG